MNNKRLLCVMSRVLGNQTISNMVVGRLERISGIDLVHYTLGPEDYRRYPAPGLVRRSNILEASWVLKNKLKQEAVPDHDAVLFNGLGLMLDMMPRLGNPPAVVLHDTTPRLMKQMQLMQGVGKVRQVLLETSGLWQDWQMSRSAKAVRAWGPMTKWCADSLVEHYGVARQRCFVTLAPKPLSVVRTQRGAGALRLLFVGNDFLRKGGDLLLDCYRRRLQGSCVLTIVSNDPVLGTLDLPAGVSWLRGLKTVQDVAPEYTRHDVLLYPSRLDQFSNVLAEAAAAGMPGIGSDVGGVRELVIDGKTGILLPYGAGWEAWATAVERFAGDVSFWQRCADAAYELAARDLTLERFDRVLGDMLAQLPV